MSNATMYIFCGKMASGKSTLAKQIAEQHSLTLIGEDVLLNALYPGQVVDVSSYVEFSGKLKLAMTPILVDLLRNGTSVVLDFPANTVNQRKWMKDIIAQANSCYEFHYLDSSDAICKDQLKSRAVKEPERHATDTSEMCDAITKYFEPPTGHEDFEVLHHVRT